MSEIVTAIFGIAVIVAVLGSVPYGIWMIYTAAKKRWRKVGFQIGVPLAVGVLLYGVAWFFNAAAVSQDLEGIYDTEVELGEPIYEYNSRRSFQGDGYSITVYELPGTIRSRFEAADESLLSGFPRRPEYRDRWSSEHWRRSPFDEQFAKYLEFALSSYDAGESSELVDHFSAIRAALQGEGNYYSFFHYDPSGRVGNIDFFVVDVIHNRLYSINHNT